MPKAYDVVGIGNAIVDVLAHCQDDFLSRMKIERGIMQLIDAPRARELYNSMSERTEISGGSAANTIAGLAALGAKTVYIGKVKDDALGDTFARDLRAQGASYETPRAPRTHEDDTGRSMIFVSPDGERSMNTYLGVTEFLTPDDIDPKALSDTDWIYLEGYRFDGPESHAAFAKAISLCKSSGGRVSLTLSDPFCVERHRSAFQNMISQDIDLLFCNEHELKSLYQESDLEVALQKTAKDVPVTACTLGERGAVVIRGNSRTEVPAENAQIVDATGAGDLFAAGFLFGVITSESDETCAKMGCIAAGEVLSHIGARPQSNLKRLFEAAGIGSAE